ncbi:hypothetical protein CDAR_599501 [Caerostris darwini]|uniref:Uncharacterized protein n=1 Tax=Caerostris darwini TaxID=1538125 RepID=A0AAV4NZD1_9ARAC|nr:hypothetical protein CDAR_599501 [Caerostris darwini]
MYHQSTVGNWMKNRLRVGLRSSVRKKERKGENGYGILRNILEPSCEREGTSENFPSPIPMPLAIHTHHIIDPPLRPTRIGHPRWIIANQEFDEASVLFIHSAWSRCLLDAFPRSLLPSVL